MEGTDKSPAVTNTLIFIKCWHDVIDYAGRDFGPKWECKDELDSTEVMEASSIHLDRGGRVVLVCMEDGTIAAILTKCADGEILAHADPSAVHVICDITGLIHLVRGHVQIGMEVRSPR